MLVSSLFALFTSAGSDTSARSVFCSFALSASTGFAVSMPTFSAPFVSAGSAGSAGSISGSSALSTFAGSVLPLLGSSALSASAQSFFARYTVLILSWCAPSTHTSSSFSESAVPMPGFFASATPMFGSSVFFASVVTSTLGKQKLIKLNQRERRVTSEELIPAFTSLLLSEPPFVFPTSCIGKNWSFDKAFNINCRLLANN